MTAQGRNQDSSVHGGRLISVSNRLPVILSRGRDGRWQADPGSGGLISALVPVLQNRGGLWIGWPGVVEEEEGTEQIGEVLETTGRDSGYTLYPVHLSASEKEDYYYGFANEIVWPIFHDLQTLCNFAPQYWRSYCQVNRKFAQTIAQHYQVGDHIWIHDYHLMKVGEELEALGIKCATGFYLHIPFPALDIFLKLPWRMEILRALLRYDLIGFQTLRDRRNFAQCVNTLIPDAKISTRRQVITVEIGDRTVRLGDFPISIDFNEFATQAQQKEVIDLAQHFHENLPQRQVLLGLDRLDYTKGIPYRLDAFRSTLEHHPELRGKISLVQIVVPSREDIQEYSDLKTEIEQTVGQINGQFTQSGWIPVHYIFRGLERVELLAYYRTCEIALITPLKDGMNLVAKEYCACKVDDNGVLILSEFAGAAAQLQEGAILVNPYHIEAVAEAIYNATQISWDERRTRMRKLRQSIQKHDIFWWVDSFLQAAFSKHLEDFPLFQNCLPHLK